MKSLTNYIKSITGVESVTIEHDDGVIDITVVGGDEVEIANAIYDRVPAGVRTRGNTGVLVGTVDGFRQQICFNYTPTLDRINEVLIEKLIDEIDRACKTKDLSRYPHECPHCQGPAYIDPIFDKVDCLKGCC